MTLLMEYLQYPFVRYALIVGILISLCSALFGVVLVLKRFSFIGDGLSHVAFGAMAIAAVAGLTLPVSQYSSHYIFARSYPMYLQSFAVHLMGAIQVYIS